MAASNLVSFLKRSLLGKDPYFKVFSTSVLVSLLVSMFAWLIAMAHFRTTIESPEVLTNYFAVSLTMLNALGLMLIGHGLWASKRLADTHASLIHACRSLQEGDFDQRFKTGTLQLTELETAFNDMAESMAQRVKA